MPEVRIQESKRFMVDVLRAAGVAESEANAHADLLLKADLVGHYSHGLNRLKLYIADIKRGACPPSARPVILKESGGTAWVDGCNGLGATVGNFCMDLAIKKAKEFGISCVVAKNGNHYGMAGYWAQKAAQEGFIGLSFTNGSPLLVPTRAKEPVLGTNPIGMAAPATAGDSILVDMATTAVALGKIEMKHHKNEPLPEGWAIDSQGKPVSDADTALTASRLMPLGGFEENSGYKGYGLSAMVECLTSCLSGSKCSYQLQRWREGDHKETMDLSHCFIAIDPAFFAPGFSDRLSGCLTTYRGLEPVDPALPVLAPGDKERRQEQETIHRDTIIYEPNQIEVCDELAKQLNVKPLQIV